MNYRMLASSCYHLVNYSIKKPMTNLEKGTLILSIDVDVGDRRLGILNQGKNDANVHRYLSEFKVGEIEEFALPMFLQAFDEYQIPATFAMRGQLAEIDFRIADVFGLKSIHEIAAHSYYHKAFTLLSLEEAEEEMALTSRGMKKMGLNPTSFIFPRNQICYLNLLPKYGYRTYRSMGGLKHDAMAIEQENDLLNVHPSFYLDNNVNLFFLKRLLSLAINKKAPLHLWFHLWNFGEKKEQVDKYLEKTFMPFLEQVQNSFSSGVLALETMGSTIRLVNAE